MSKVFGVGVIGSGDILYFHALALSALGERTRLIGIADLDKNKLARAQGRYSVPFTYSDYRELLAREDIDIIVVATPPSTHEQFVVAALEAGKHVICEKPLAHNLESADRIIESAEKTDCKVTVCNQERYMTAIRRALWLRDKGWLGNLQFGDFERMTPPSGTTVAPWWGKWGIAGGGAVITQFIHQLDTIIKIFGDPISVISKIDTLYRDIESEDTFAAIIKFKSGAIVNCSGSLNSHQNKTKYDIIGDKASVHLPWSVNARDGKHLKNLKQAMIDAKMLPETQKGGLLASVKNKIVSQFTGNGIPVKIMRKIMSKLGIKRFIGEPPLHTYIIENFLNAIEQKNEVPVSVEEARRSLELCTAIYASSIDGCEIAIPFDKSNGCYRGITADLYNQKRKARELNTHE